MHAYVCVRACISKPVHCLLFAAEGASATATVVVSPVIFVFSPVLVTSR